MSHEVLFDPNADPAQASRRARAMIRSGDPCARSCAIFFRPWELFAADGHGRDDGDGDDDDQGDDDGSDDDDRVDSPRRRKGARRGRDRDREPEDLSTRVIKA